VSKSTKISALGSNYEIFKALSLCNLCNFNRQGGFAPSVQDNNEALEHQMASKMGDLPTIYPIDEHMGLQWLPVPKFQIHMEMIGPVSSIGCINRVHHVESNGFSTSMEQLRKDWGSSS
jgi:hypothetical protein